MRNIPKGKVIDRAYTKVKPISPNKIVVPVLGLIFGIVGGVVCTNYLISRRKRCMDKKVECK